MFVCICNSVSDKDLRASFDEGARSVSALQMKTGCGTCCGCCLEMVNDLVNEWGPSVPYTPEAEPHIAPLDLAEPAPAVKPGVSKINPGALGAGFELDARRSSPAP